MRRMVLVIIAAMLALCEGRGPAPARAQPAGAGPAVAPAPALAPAPPMADRLARIRARGTLQVCHLAEAYGLSWRNPRNGELEGMDLEMAQLLAIRLAVRPDLAEMPGPRLMERLEQGGCDLAVGGLGVTPARSRRIGFSKPYMASPLYLVTTRGNTRLTGWRELDRAGRIVATIAEGPVEDLLRPRLRQAQLVAPGPAPAAEREVMSGRADALVTDFAESRRLLMQGWARAEAPPAPMGEVLFAYGVPPGEAAWLAEVNAFLATVKADGRLAAAATRHGLASILLP